MTVVGYVAADVDHRRPDEIIDLLVGARYGAVDWTMEQFDPLVAPASELVAMCTAARDAGLATPQLMVHQDYVTLDPALWEERVRRTELAIDAAAAAGIGSIGVVTGPNRWVEGYTALDEAQSWQLATAALERALARAKRVGVTVALEPCWGTIVDNAERADRMIAALNDPDLGLTLDPSHFVLSGDDIAALPARWAERIAHVHLKDAFGVPGEPDEDFCFLLPGEGRVPWAELLPALTASGYDGPMCVEYESFTLLEGPLHGDLSRAAALARELADGLLAPMSA